MFSKTVQMPMPRPKTEYLNNCKVANYISTQSDSFSKTLQLTTIPKENIFVTVDLTADENLALSNPNITQYDMAIMDAVYTLLVNGATTFTPEMVVRIMSGNFDQDVTRQKYEAVTTSLRKLSMIRITIDCTNELRTRKKICAGDTARLTSYLMPLREIDIQSANHQTIMHGYQLIEKPVLYTYAEMINQIINIPTELLEISNSSGSRHLSDTDEVIVIKRALIRRIALLKNAKNHMANHTIRYEYYASTIDSETGFLVNSETGFLATLGFNKSNYSQWKKKRSSLHRIITTILDDFIKEKYIAEYEVIKQGPQKVVGVKIIL